MKRIGIALSLMSAAALTAAGCASTSANLQKDEDVLAPANVAPLSAQAADLFAAASDPEKGIAVTIDLDAMRKRGLADNVPQKEGGYTLVQLLAPFVREITSVSTDMAKPLAEGLVYASLLDRAIPLPVVKRAGFYLPVDVTGDMTLDEALQEAAILLGVDSSEIDAKTLLADISTALHLKDALFSSNSSEGAASEEAGGGEGAENKETKMSFSLEDGMLCAVRGEPASKMCILGGEGVYAVGKSEVLSALRSAEKKPAGDRTEFAHIYFAAPSIGSILLSSTEDADGSLPVTITYEAADREMVQKIAPMAAMALEQRRQAQSEFDMELAMALQNLQKAVAEDGSASERMKKAAADMTLKSITDPYEVGFGGPDAIKFTSEGTHVELSFRIPGGFIDHLSITSYNWRNSLKGQLVSGLMAGAAKAAEMVSDKMKEDRMKRMMEEAAGPDAEEAVDEEDAAAKAAAEEAAKAAKTKSAKGKKKSAR